MHDAFDFTRHEETLKSVAPKAKQAKILTLMLQDVCGCCDFIQSYTKDLQFSLVYSGACVNIIGDSLESGYVLFDRDIDVDLSAVLLVIFQARPEVVVNVAALALKSGASPSTTPSLTHVDDAWLRQRCNPEGQ